MYIICKDVFAGNYKKIKDGRLVSFFSLHFEDMLCGVVRFQDLKTSVVRSTCAAKHVFFSKFNEKRVALEKRTGSIFVYSINFTFFYYLFFTGQV